MSESEKNLSQESRELITRVNKIYGEFGALCLDTALGSEQIESTIRKLFDDCNVTSRSDIKSVWNSRGANRVWSCLEKIAMRKDGPAKLFADGQGGRYVIGSLEHIMQWMLEIPANYGIQNCDLTEHGSTYQALARLQEIRTANPVVD